MLIKLAMGTVMVLTVEIPRKWQKKVEYDFLDGWRIVW